MRFYSWIRDCGHYFYQNSTTSTTQRCILSLLSNLNIFYNHLVFLFPLDRTPDLITINYKSLNKDGKYLNKNDAENCSKYQLIQEESYIDGKH